MKRIYKYTVPIDDKIYVHDMPFASPIVHVGSQDDSYVTFWAVNDDQEAILEHRSFIVVGTGHPFPPNSEYVGTTTPQPFVWHLLELH